MGLTIQWATYKGLGHVLDKKPPKTFISRLFQTSKANKGKIALGATAVGCLGSYGLYRWWTSEVTDDECPVDETSGTIRRRRVRKPTSRPKNQSWGWLWCILALVVLAMVAGGYYFYMQEESEELEDLENPFEEAF